MPTAIQAASEWAANHIASGAERRSCSGCGLTGTAYLLCNTCDKAFCRPCLELDKWALWSLAFQCPPCMIEEVRRPEATPGVNEGLLKLARSHLHTMAAALKPATWLLYQRCVSQMMQFSADHQLQIFPVTSTAAAKGLGLFFEHLRGLGYSWARITHYRTAIRKLCQTANLPDPWEEHPYLNSVCEGLKKRITLRMRRKEGMTLEMVKALLQFWEASEKAYRSVGKHRLANTCLRHQVAVVLGFWGMRRASEVRLNASGSMGLKREHVVLVPDSHVTLFLQSQKNDTFATGNEIFLAWVTGSGVAIGELFSRYVRWLDCSDIPPEAPFLCPTDGAGMFTPPRPGVSFNPTDCLRHGLKQVFQEFSEQPELLSQFSWHSLRRGGASHAAQSQVDRQHIMGHGVWRSEDGIRPYVMTNFEGKLGVTERM
mmetsp:Transcript_47303/g.96675  ORF Transcript_47303/g.96675 Transcript_47303/m.96675 type:complete len:428 (+) Transcript_47303:665-1948(+)